MALGIPGQYGYHRNPPRLARPRAGGGAVNLYPLGPRRRQALTVDEETVVWATTVDGSGSYRKNSLLADPTTEYDTGVRDDCANSAVWIKAFI